MVSAVSSGSTRKTSWSVNGHFLTFNCRQKSQTLDFVTFVFASSRCSCETKQMRNLARAFTAHPYKGMDVAKDPDQNYTSCLLDTSAWALKGGFCAYAINTNI